MVKGSEARIRTAPIGSALVEHTKMYECAPLTPS
jgi:hypothetical protein